MDVVVQKAKQADLPHDVRLVATVARLLDLHNSRRERGSRSTNVVQRPQVSAAAGELSPNFGDGRAGQAAAVMG